MLLAVLWSLGVGEWGLITGAVGWLSLYIHQVVQVVVPGQFDRCPRHISQFELSIILNSFTYGVI